MYICQITGKTSKPGDALNKVVIEKRPRVYRNWDREKEEVWESTGWEIVREINASDEGVTMWNEMSADEKEHFIKRFMK